MNKAIQKAAAELPEGWEVSVHARADSGWVQLWGPSHFGWDDGDYPDHTLAERVVLAIERAKAEAKR